MSKAIKQLSIGGSNIPIVDGIQNNCLKGFYIYSYDVPEQAFYLSSRPRFNDDGSENTRLFTADDALELHRWLEVDGVYFDAHEVSDPSEGIGAQYVSYDIGIFYSLVSKIKPESDTTDGQVMLDTIPNDAVLSSDSNFVDKLAEDKDFIIYAPLTPDAGTVEIATNQFQQGFGTAVGNAAVSLCGESKSLGPYSFTAGRGNTAGYGAAAFGFESVAFANHSFVQGTNCNVLVNANNGSAFGHGSITSGIAAFSTGHVAKAQGKYSFAQGNGTTAAYDNQAVFGKYNVSGNYAIIVGGGSASSLNNIATIDWSGNAVFDGAVSGTKFCCTNSTASSGSIAIGNSCEASGAQSFAGGTSSEATGGQSFAFGNLCKANATKAVCFGHETTATGHSSMAIGRWTQSTGNGTLAIGDGTLAAGTGQLSLGKYNSSDSSKYLVIGNGSSTSSRNTVFSVATNGAVMSKSTLTFNGSNVISKVHTLNITYTDGTTSTIKVAGVN